MGAGGGGGRASVGTRSIAACAGTAARPAKDRPPSSGDDAMESSGGGRGGTPPSGGSLQGGVASAWVFHGVEDDAAAHHQGMNLGTTDQGQIGGRSIGRDRDDVPGRGGRRSEPHISGEVHHHMVAVLIQTIDGLAVRIDHHPTKAGMVARPHGRSAGLRIRPRRLTRTGQQSDRAGRRMRARSARAIIRSSPAACRYPTGPWHAPGVADRSTGPRRWQNIRGRVARLH